MATAITAQLTITPEAAEHVRRLGLESPLQRMIEHTQAAVEGLQELRVCLARDPVEDDPRVILQVTKDPGPTPGADTSEDEWSEWKLASFPPEVCIHFCLLSAYRERNGR